MRKLDQTIDKNFLLLSLKHSFALKIKEGKKTWEYRKVVPSRPVDGIIFYCPEIKDFFSYHSKITTVIASPREICLHSLDHPSLEESLLRYFKNKTKVVAFKLERSHFLENGIKQKFEELTQSRFKAPQSFLYIDSQHPLNQILELNL